MTEYRAFPKDTRIYRPPTVITAGDDLDAIAQAGKLVGGLDIELWDGNRRAVTLTAKPHHPRRPSLPNRSHRQAPKPAARGARPGPANQLRKAAVVVPVFKPLRPH